MIDELFIYDRETGLFKQIIDQLEIIQTYHVSPNYGHDLNTNNLELFLKDPVYGISDVKQKYPICVCITPRSRRVKINSYVWEQFFFTLYFLQRTYIDGKNKTRNPDPETNISRDAPSSSWSLMKKEANNFLSIFEATVRGNATIDSNLVPFHTILNIDFDRVDIRRLSNFTSDKLSGIEITFSMYLNIDLCEISENGIDYTVSPYYGESDPIWMQDKVHYYTIDEINTMFSAITQAGVAIGVTLIGNINNSNLVFTTPELYAAGSIRVYYNGQRQKIGASKDYFEIDNSTIQFTSPPKKGIVTADYVKL